MKTIVTPDNSYASLLPELTALGESKGLRGYAWLELEDATLRGLNADGKVIQDCYIGDAAAAPFHAQIAQIETTAKAESDAAEAIAKENAPKTAGAFAVMNRLTNDEVAKVVDLLVKQGVIDAERRDKLVAL